MAKTLAAEILLLTLAACGSAKNRSYKGEPLATLHGDLLASAPISGAPRLAMLWYNAQDPFSSTNPPAIVASDIPYQGSFPIAYSFDLYDPPPDEAQTAIRFAGDTVHISTGIIAAYLDNNHNGVLDLIPTDGEAVDTVLGVSMPDNGDPYASQAFTLAYFDHAIATESMNAATPGFHLHAAAQEVPGNTPVPIHLTSAPDLNLFVCAQLFAIPQVVPKPGTACAVQATPRLLQVVAAVGNSQNYFSVTNGILPVENATVTVDGTLLAWDSQLSLFRTNPLSAGPHVFHASVPGLGSSDGSFRTLGPVHISTPNQSSPVNYDPVHVSWDPVAEAVGYHVYINTGLPGTLYDDYTSGTFLNTIPIPFTGGVAGVSVIAYGPNSITDAFDPQTGAEVVTQIMASSEQDLSLHGAAPALSRSPDEARVLRGRFIP